MKSKSKSLIICSVLFLTACASTKTLIVDPIDKPDRLPPADALVECQRPAELSSDQFGEVVRKLSETIHLLDLCETKRKELQDFIQ